MQPIEMNKIELAQYFWSYSQCTREQAEKEADWLYSTITRFAEHRIAAHFYDDMASRIVMYLSTQALERLGIRVQEKKLYREVPAEWCAENEIPYKENVWMKKVNER